MFLDALQTIRPYLQTEAAWIAKYTYCIFQRIGRIDTNNECILRGHNLLDQ